MPKQATSLQVKGVKEQVAKLRALQNVSVSQDVARMLGNEGNGFRKLASQKMRERNWPKEALENEGFVDARWPQSRRGKKKVSILFGFGKQYRPGYVEWGGDLAHRRTRRTPVRKVGMSLLTLFEFGGGGRKKVAGLGGLTVTKRPMTARPAWREAITQYRKTCRGNIREGIDALMRRYVRG